MKAGTLLYNDSDQTTKTRNNSVESTEETDDKFDPTSKLLLRIMKVILENDSIGRTTLTLKANVNYTILAKHLDWLEKRSLVECFVDEGKIKVRLTVIGIEFAFRLSHARFLNY